MAWYQNMKTGHIVNNPMGHCEKLSLQLLSQEKATNGNPFTDDEMEFIKDCSLTNMQVVELTGRSHSTVYGKRKSLGINYRRGNRPIKKDELNVIYDMTLSTQEVSDKLGLTYQQVYVKRYNSGLI